MTVEATDHSPGVHQFTDVATGRQQGRYFGAHDIDEVIYQEGYISEISTKPFPTQGNHKACLPYGLSVRKVTKNEPGRWKRYITQGDPPEVTVNLEGDDHISRIHHIDSWWPGLPGYDNAIDRSITLALDNLSQRSAGIGADLAQAKKTVDEFADLASRFAGGFNALRRKNLSLAWQNFFRGSNNRNQSFSGSVADWWLKYIYGIKPLMDDLYEAGEAVGIFLNKPLLVEGHGKGKTSHEESFLWEDRIFHKGSAKSTARTTLRAQVDNPLLAVANASGLTNPAEIAWELVPWSFALDWFIPVGNTLQALTAGCGLTYLGGWTSTKSEVIATLTHKSTFNGYGYGIVQSGVYEKESYTFHRRCHPNLPLPRFYANESPYSTTRALNALALVQQLTK